MNAAPTVSRLATEVSALPSGKSAILTGAIAAAAAVTVSGAAYTVHEVTPAGYSGEGDKTVTVDNVASCSDDPFAGETVSGVLWKLTNLAVSVDSQVDGGTASTTSSASMVRPSAHVTTTPLSLT